ncbi:L-threonylcarbamoyladenylate synthase [Shimazuella kribbensis]|uniref:L-threonylcarbamoyladenylate synthase n=1 Tax=Shimazuella kribbensis TaxID=139808 RepID=UPI000404EFCD|nr:L-threonylcarbamoyladenylate synthase [Shimazuella kribbensis]
MTTVIKFPREKALDFYRHQIEIKKAAQLIQTGGLVAFPTETVYGLGADATNESAVKQIFQAKGRPSDNPLIVHLATIEQMDKWISDIPDLAKRLMKHFSPGPITYVMRHQGGFADSVTAGLDTVGIRIPDHPLALALLELADVPVAAPSANRSGRPSPTSASHVAEDLSGKIDLILDGGITTVGVESTVVDVTEGIPILLRPGGVTLEALKAVVGEVSVDTNQKEQPRSPGMKYRHYAPKGEMWLVDGDDMVKKIQYISQEKMAEGYQIGVLTTEENKDKYKSTKTVICGNRSQPDTVARQLYDALRKFDTLGVDLIYAETFPMTDIYLSVMNRLLKAAEGKYFIK